MKYHQAPLAGIYAPSRLRLPEIPGSSSPGGRRFFQGKVRYPSVFPGCTIKKHDRLIRAGRVLFCFAARQISWVGSVRRRSRANSPLPPPYSPSRRHLRARLRKTGVVYTSRGASQNSVIFRQVFRYHEVPFEILLDTPCVSHRSFIHPKKCRRYLSHCRSHLTIRRDSVYYQRQGKIPYRKVPKQRKEETP